MSFSAEVKAELSKVINTNKHCRNSELAAMFQYGGEMGRLSTDNYTIGFQSENKNVIKKGFTLLKKTFNIDFDKNISEQQLISFVKSINWLEEKVSDYLIKKDCCKRAYIRGAFLCIGSVSDPTKGYHLEFVCADEEQAVYLKQLIATFSIEGKIIERKEHYVLYFKESAQIIGLFNVMEAHISQHKIEELRSIKEVRNTVNRRINCEMANINKMVSAASKQKADIELIEQAQGISSLPDSLYDIAILRLEYPDITLKELGELLEPPVGKSGVNHRLRKIADIADKIREQQYNG